MSNGALWPGKLLRSQALGLGVSGTIISVTGVGMVLFRYFLASPDPFSVHPHGSWPWLIMAHVLATPAFFFFVGAVWRPHVELYWRRGHRRLGGGLLVASLLLIVLSGYLLYFVGREEIVALTRVAHAISGITGIAFAAFHSILGFRMLARARRAHEAQLRPVPPAD